MGVDLAGRVSEGWEAPSAATWGEADDLRSAAVDAVRATSPLSGFRVRSIGGWFFRRCLAIWALIAAGIEWGSGTTSCRRRSTIDCCRQTAKAQVQEGGDQGRGSVSSDHGLIPRATWQVGRFVMTCVGCEASSQELTRSCSNRLRRTRSGLRVPSSSLKPPDADAVTRGRRGSRRSRPRRCRVGR